MAYAVTYETGLKEIKKHKRRYDKDIRHPKLEPRYLVLVGQKAFGGKYKIQDNWENAPYAATEKPYPVLLVYKVASSECDDKPKALHHNLLFPLLGVLQDEP